jgi:hypothetical protein
MSNDAEVVELIRITKKLSKIYSEVIPLYNRQQLLLVKLKKRLGGIEK